MISTITTWVLVIFLANGRVGWQAREYKDCQMRAAAIAAGVPQFVEFKDGGRVQIKSARCLPADEAMRRYFRRPEV
jgi:hypothetical protein